MAIVKGLPFYIKLEMDVEVYGYDGIIFLSAGEPHEDVPDPMIDAIAKARNLNKAVENEGVVVEVNLPAGRMVYVPISINPDFDDIRSFREAGKLGIEKALKAGFTKPLVVFPTLPGFQHLNLVTLLGIFDALYVNLQYREKKPEVFPRYNTVGIFSFESRRIDEILQMAIKLENGRYVARDIGGGDPERMAPRKVEKYVRAAFRIEPVRIDVIRGFQTLKRDYPLFAAVSRATNEIERHQGRIIVLTYEGIGSQETLFLVGKGVTYNTGGVDIKTGGTMAGMSRDKCSAAAVCGFLKFVAQMKPSWIKVVGILCILRNSVGENSYVSDEIITSRAGVRVRINNTDADGQICMADALCLAKEMALRSRNPHLFTVTTSTDHKYLAPRSGYSIVMDNSVARQAKSGQALCKLSEQIGEPFELSILRREDYKFPKSQVEGEDLLQASSQLSSCISRKHQVPAAFLISASGLDKHGLESEFPLKYSHLDITGAVGDFPENVTGAPILALFARFFRVQFLQLSDIPCCTHDEPEPESDSESESEHEIGFRLVL